MIPLLLFLLALSIPPAQTLEDTQQSLLNSFLNLGFDLSPESFYKSYNTRDHVSRKPDPECFMSPGELAAHNGFQLATHWVRTEDGYILGVHNIARRRGSPVVFLQHGLLDSSMTWMLNGRQGSLAFLLSDAGFDVWMGNVRGNTFSRNHTSLSPKSEEFWDFSFDEMAAVDLPNMVDYVLNRTGERQLVYVGHSQGTEIGFIEFPRNTRLSKQVKLFVALAPVARVDHIQGLFKYLTDSQKLHEWVFKEFQIKEFLPRNSLMRDFAISVCPVEPTLCYEILSFIAGYSKGNLNTTRTEVYLSHTPAGTSVKNMIHWAQISNARRLQMYDYESEKENMKHYGTPKPPQYNVTGLSVPTVLVTGEDDYLSDSRDAMWLLQRIKHTVIKLMYLDNYNHLDFLWSMNAPDRVYYPIIDIMKTML